LGIWKKDWLTRLEWFRHYSTMIANSTNFDDDQEDEYEDDPSDEKSEALKSLIANLKDIIEKNETSTERKARIEKTRTLYQECAAEVERLSAELQSASLTNEEVDAKSEEISELNISSLEREYKILEESMEVIKPRIKERVSDARQNLDSSLRETFNEYLVSLDDAHFDSLVLALAGKKPEIMDYRDLMLGFFDHMAEKEKENEVCESLGPLRPLLTKRHYWHGFNELFIKPFADIHTDPKTFHHLIRSMIEKAKTDRSEQQSNRRIGWIIIAVVVGVITFFVLGD
jgi:hypothetical protein